MKQAKRIFLLSNDQDPLARLEGVLRVAGYDVQLRHRADEAILLCTAQNNTDRQFNLMIMGAVPGRENLAKSLLQGKLVIPVLFADFQSEKREPYIIQGHLGWLYHESALLAAVRELLRYSTASSQNDNPALAFS